MNFTDGGIRCPCRKCKNLKFLHQDVVTMHLLTKGFMEDYLCWYAHGELFVPDESMEEQVVGSTSSSTNMHEVGNENSNHRRITHIPKRTHVRRVSVCTSTDGSKSLAGFSNVFGAHIN